MPRPVHAFSASERTGLFAPACTSGHFYLPVRDAKAPLWHTTRHQSSPFSVLFTVLRFVLRMSFFRCCRSRSWLFCCFLMFGFSSVNALDLNQATRAQLRAIKGVGDKLADRILAARAHGRFVSMEDVAARVAGVGPKKLKKLREQGVRAGSLAGRSVHQAASARSPGNKPARSDPDQSTPVRRNAVASIETANDLKHAGDGLARRPIPAMPMLIRPRPRADSASSDLGKEPVSTAAQRKTH